MLNLFNYNSATVIPAAATVDKVKLSFLEWLAEEEATRRNDYSTYREYYDGDHDTQLTDRMRQFLQIKSNQEFNTNYCPIVVDAIAERLIVTGFNTSDQKKETDNNNGQKETQSELFWQWWNKNRMDAQQRVVHTSAGRDGDSYCLVEWNDDTGMPQFIPEMAFDGHEGVKVYYSHDRRGVVEFATKRWRIERGQDAGYRRRLNVYYPDRIEKYYSDGREGGDWRKHYEDEDTDFVQWWTDTGTESGQPLGVPVFPFKANDRGYNYGKSDLHDIIPVQNALNKSVIDLLAAADSSGFRMLSWRGDDPTNVTVAPGMNIYSLKPPNEVAIDVIPGEDVTPMINLKDSFVGEIGKISRIPLSYFQSSGQVAAEGTLKQQESGLLARITDRQTSFGNSWEDVMAMGRRLHNAFGSGKLNEDEQISTMWADAEIRNEREHIEALGIKVEKLGVPMITAWREADYSPDEIVQMLEDAAQQDQFGINQGGQNPGVTQ